MGIAKVAAQASTVSLGVSAVLPSAAVIENAVTNAMILGAPSRDWWAKQSADAAFKFSQEVRQGIAASETIGQITQRALKVLDTTQAGARALVHTSVSTVANEARMAVYEANDDIIKRYRALATLDTSTCMQCAPYDGLEWEKDRTPIGHSLPFPTYPKHINCLTGDSLISAADDITGHSKRWFDGEVIVIKTAGDRTLTCTPNHPILTSSGWVAAGLLDVGGDVITDSFGKGGGLGDGNHKDVPARIEDVVGSLLSTGQMVPVPMPVSPKDFHGDGVGSDVAVVYSESFLSGDDNSASGKHLGECHLCGGLLDGSSSFLGIGGSDEPAKFGGSTTNGFMGGACEEESIFGAGIRHSSELLLASVSGLDSSVPESAGNTGPTKTHVGGDTGHANPVIKQAFGLYNIDVNLLSSSADSGAVEAVDDDANIAANLAGELLAGNPISVSTDKIVDVKREFFSGHVYNLETVKGWYVSNGIITHNCRCLLIGRVTTGEPGGGRATAGGPVSAKTTFSDWLGRQSSEKQTEILGKGRAELYQSGKITLSDVVNGRGSPLSVKQLQAKYQ